METPVEQAWAERALIAEERCRQLEADNERLRASADPDAARKLTDEIVTELTRALGPKLPTGYPAPRSAPRQVGVWRTWVPQSKIGRLVAALVEPKRDRVR